MMLHLAPELVDMSKADAARAREARRQHVRALRWPGQLRLAVERLPPRRLHRRSDRGHRRAWARAVRRRGARRSARPAEIAAFDFGRLTMADWHATCASTATGCWQRLEALGEIGAVHGPNGERGCARLALTDADRDGPRPGGGVDARPRPARRDRRDRQRRRHPRRHRPDAAPVMIGSHIDTVRTGGRFDGNLGVLGRAGGDRDAGAARRRHRPPDQRRVLHRRGGRPLRTRHARQPRVRRRAWRSRRRSTCAPPTTAPGSATSWPASATPARCRARPPSCPHAYVELHIEQGPVLEDEGITIGVVTGVQGISWTEVTHHRPVGPRRHDADAAAPRPLARGRRDHPRTCACIAGEMGGTQVATVGRLDVHPEPGQRGAGDGRDHGRPAQHRRGGCCSEAEAEASPRCCAQLADDEGVRRSRRARWPASSRSSSTPAMIDLVEATAQRLGHSTRRMPSGAGHDAQMLARVCPTAMIFVPSVERPVAQHRRVHRRRPTSRPAPTCCCRWCCDRADAVATGTRRAPAEAGALRTAAIRMYGRATDQTSRSHRVDELVGDDVLGCQAVLRRLAECGVDRRSRSRSGLLTRSRSKLPTCRRGRWRPGRRP